MELKKQEIIKRLGELGKVRFMRPTAMELRSPRPLLSRVQRQENKRYQMNVEKQKARLKSNLKKVESYMASVKAQEDYLANTPSVLPQPEVMMGILSAEQQLAATETQQSYLTSVQAQQNYLTQAPTLKVKPSIIIRKKPVLKRTRLSRYKPRQLRGGRY